MTQLTLENATEAVHEKTGYVGEQLMYWTCAALGKYFQARGNVAGMNHFNARAVQYNHAK